MRDNHNPAALILIAALTLYGVNLFAVALLLGLIDQSGGPSFSIKSTLFAAFFITAAEAVLTILVDLDDKHRGGDSYD